MSTTPDAALALYYRSVLELAWTPSFALLDNVLASLAEVASADRVSIEISTGLLRRTWSRSHPDTLQRTASAPRICVPILIGTTVGSVQLERSGEAFNEGSAEHAKVLARQLAHVVTGFDDAFVPRRLKDEVRLLQQRRVIEAVEKHCGNVTAAARALGVSRTFVNRVAKETRR